MTKHLVAFSAEEAALVAVEMDKLVRSLQGRKVEEGDWTDLYCKVKNAPNHGWSNLPFKDYYYNGVGIEFKIMMKDAPSNCIGRSIMHPSATRKIAFDPNEPAADAMAKVLTQWGAAIDGFEKRVKSTSSNGTADLRWGILLWARDHSEFLYFEEELSKPRIEDYDAIWHVGNHRGNETRNLRIFERTTGKLKFSCTLPANGHKLQPYFEVPNIRDGAHIFRPTGANTVPLFIDRAAADEFSAAFPGLDSDAAFRLLLDRWKMTGD